MIVLAVSGAVAAVSFVIELRARAEADERTLLARARIASQAVEEQFDRLTEVVAACARSPNLIERLDFDAFRKECVRFETLFGGWIVVADRGPAPRQLFNSRLPAGAPLPGVERLPAIDDLDRRSRASGAVEISDAFLGARTGEPVIIAGRAIRLADGSEALIAGVKSARSFSELLSTIDAASEARNGDVLGVVDGRFRLIARSARSEERAMTDAPPWYVEMAQSGPVSVARGLAGPLPGDPRLDAAVKRLAAAHGWTVFAVRWQTAPATALLALAARPLAFALAAALLSALAMHLWNRDALRRAHVETIEARLAEARRAERERSALMYRLGHEVRGPIVSLLGALELGRHPDGSGDDDGIAAATRAGETVLQHVDDVLELAFLGSGRLTLNPTPTDPCDAVRRVVARFEPEAQRKGLEIAVEKTGAAGALVRIDRLRFEQIVANLLSNAVKFTPAGRIALRLAQAPQPDGTTDLALAVADSGPGVPADRRLAIFEEPHARDEDRGAKAGSGLGLPISRRLARAMGGDIDVVDAPSDGATFRLRLRAPIAASGHAKGQPHPALSGFFIVFAEDEPTIRELTSRRLTDAGARVAAVGDGAAALDAGRRDRPDLFLLDIEMPVMDGVEATRRIRADTALRGVPVFGLTSHVAGRKTAMARVAGMDEVLTKPLQIAPIAAALKARRGVSGRNGTAADSTEAPSLLDERVFADLHRGIPASVFGGYIDRFESDSRALLTKVADAVQAGDTLEARHLAHSLKGLAMTFGAAALADAVQTFEGLVAAADRHTGYEMQAHRVAELLAETRKAMDGIVTVRDRNQSASLVG